MVGVVHLKEITPILFLGLILNFKMKTKSSLEVVFVKNVFYAAMFL